MNKFNYLREISVNLNSKSNLSQNLYDKVEIKVKEAQPISIASLPQDETQVPQDQWVQELIEDEFENDNQFKDQNMKVRIQDEFLKNGPLDPLFRNSDVTEIIINGPNSICYEESGEFKILDDHFYSNLTFNNFIQKICDSKNIQLSLNTPCEDFTYENFRVHIIQPPLTEKEICICFRRHPENPWRLNLLRKKNWCDNESLNHIKKLVLSNKNILIVGGTGTGKTSLLNACLQEIKPNERVVSIEDTKEIHIPNRISTQLLTRVDHQEQLKTYNQSQLVKQALRMRPHRLIMGEIRGEEAKDFLMALSTGHRGSLSTLHADSAQQALLRLEMLIQMGAPQWQHQAIRQLIQLGLDNIIVLKNKNGHRELEGIYKLTSLEETGFLLENFNAF